MQAKVGKPEPIMGFGRNTNKFKSVFGMDGAQINAKKLPDFAASQKIDKK